MMGFDTILVANRGEIALRILRTARRLGYRTVAVYSEADCAAPHVAAADMAICLGAPESAQSYLNVDKIIAAARQSGAGAVHPGYGFLSENAEFADACVAAGLVFIGPDPKAIRIMGDKALARVEMQAAGVACVPGYDGGDQSPDHLAQEAQKIGYPVMIKAAAGGGGKGMRLVATSDGFDAALVLAKSEAHAAFGSDHMLLERAIATPRHVEIQVFGDQLGTVMHLGERDCSVQRRHQKVLEEAPGPGLSADLRARMGATAVQAARAIGYVGAGTVEFLLDTSGDFYFLEMNTRLQVEHPVTEMVTGYDLVEWQIMVAEGRALPVAQEDLKLTGWAIEARLYAEDPSNDFLPTGGPVLRLDLPEGAGLRCDMGIAQGNDITPYYDPMLGKLIAHGDSRDEARRRLLMALRSLVLFGPVTNQQFLIRALEHPGFAQGQATTDFVEQHLPSKDSEAAPQPELLAVAAALLFVSVAQEASPRLSRPAHYLFEWDAKELPVTVTRMPAGLCVDLGEQYYVFERLEFDGRHWRAERDGTMLSGAAMVPSEAEIWLSHAGDTLHLQDHLSSAGTKQAAEDGGQVRAPMHGRVVALHLQQGDIVGLDQPVLVLEAMKMQHTLRAGCDGQVSAVLAAEGDQVEAGQLLVEIDPKEAS